MFLCDVTMAYFGQEKSVEERLVTRLRQLGYIPMGSNYRRQDVENIIVNIADSDPSKLKVIGEPLVYKFMYERGK